MKNKFLLTGIILSLLVLFITSCQEPEQKQEPYPTDINVKNFPDFPEDRRIPAPEFTYTVSGANATLKWKNISNIEYYILYIKIIKGNYIVGTKIIDLNELIYDSNFSTNSFVTYTFVENDLNVNKIPSGNPGQYGLRAISVDGTKSDIYWAPRPSQPSQP